MTEKAFPSVVLGPYERHSLSLKRLRSSRRMVRQSIGAS